VRDALTYLRLTARLVVRNDAWILVIPGVLLLIVGVWTGYFVDPGTWKGSVAILQAEVFGPFVAAFLFAGLLDAEHRRDAGEIVFSKPHPAVILLGTRLILALLVSLGAILVLLVCYKLKFNEVPIWQALWMATPPCLFIGTVALTSGHFAKSAAAGYAIPLTFWLWDTSLGMLYNPLYVLPVGAIAEEAGPAPLPFDVTWAKSAMLLTAAVLFWINVRKLKR
jgi:hypothetical protein